MAVVHQVVWAKMNVFDADGNPTILKGREFLPDGVDQDQINMLMNIGAVRALETVEVPETDQPSEPEADELQKPSPSADKPAWVAYASDERNPLRLTQSQAENMSKSALMDRFKGQ
jgi:hypothetical protein